MIDIKNLPLTIRVSDVAEILDICLANAYELTRKEDFPLIRVNRRIIIPRDAFLKYAKLINF